MKRIATHCLIVSDTEPSHFNCLLEISDEGDLLRILPFTEETENTIWHRGTLHLSSLKEQILAYDNSGNVLP